jgi:hypothetical protein
MPMPVQQQQLPPQGMVPPPQQAFNYQSPPMPMQQNQPVNQSVSYPNLEQIPPPQNSYQNYGSAPPPTHQQQQYQPNHVNQVTFINYCGFIKISNIRLKIFFYEFFNVCECANVQFKISKLSFVGTSNCSSGTKFRRF